MTPISSAWRNAASVFSGREPARAAMALQVEDRAARRLRARRGLGPQPQASASAQAARRLLHHAAALAARRGDSARDDLGLARDAQHPAALGEQHGMAGSPAQVDECLQRHRRGRDDDGALVLGAGVFVLHDAQGMRRPVEAQLHRRMAGVEPQRDSAAPRRGTARRRCAPSASRPRMTMAPVSTLSGFMRRTNSAT